MTIIAQPQESATSAATGSASVTTSGCASARVVCDTVGVGGSSACKHPISATDFCFWAPRARTKGMHSLRPRVGGRSGPCPILRRVSGDLAYRQRLPGHSHPVFRSLALRMAARFHGRAVRSVSGEDRTGRAGDHAGSNGGRPGPPAHRRQAVRAAAPVPARIGGMARRDHRGRDRQSQPEHRYTAGAQGAGVRQSERDPGHARRNTRIHEVAGRIPFLMRSATASDGTCISQATCTANCRRIPQNENAARCASTAARCSDVQICAVGIAQGK